ncbi:MAG TPA: hypothetical protein DCM05_03480 [Elusimicrobia bacterium]|nr:hypothetical protein [Elusimicrobiota bacterium]
MLCSRCQKNEASVFFKQIVNNQIAQIALCADCAQIPELPPAAVPPIFDLLSKLGGLAAGRAAAQGARAKDPACKACGLRYSAFRETGMLGCPACYESFAGPMEGLLQQIHGASRHGGKAPQNRRTQPPEDAASLRERLKEAVRREDFEEAALLRDRLRALGEP